MSADVPRGDLPDESAWRNPRVLEEREAELVEKVISLAERGVAKDATVAEAVREIYRAMREEPEIQALIKQLMAMTVEGGGEVMRDWGNWWRENRLSQEDS